MFGYKKHCEYGRTNFNWNVFENNLLKVTDYVNTISSTISVYSLLTTPELMAYMKNLNISTYLSIVVAPKHLDIRLLPLDIKASKTLRMASAISGMTASFRNWGIKKAKRETNNYDFEFNGGLREEQLLIYDKIIMFIYIQEMNVNTGQ